MTIVIMVDKLPKDKKKRRKYLLQKFGSGTVDSGYVLFMERTFNN